MSDEVDPKAGENPLNAFALLRAGSKRTHPGPPAPPPQRGSRPSKQISRQSSSTRSSASQAYSEPQQAQARRQPSINALSILTNAAKPKCKQHIGSQGSRMRPTTLTPPTHAAPNTSPASASSTEQAITTTSGLNAFSVLASNAAKAFEAHHFCLNLVDGQWHTAIWQVGSDMPQSVGTGKRAWAATAKVSLPRAPTNRPGSDATATPAPKAGGKQVVELLLRTNMAPSAMPPQTVAGTQIRVALQQVKPPGSERFTGNVALLKSALQVWAHENAALCVVASLSCSHITHPC
jgi:hypothetical protein